MIISTKLFKQKKIIHGFFNKEGGKSEGIYKSLNCGPGSNDKKSKVKENLKIVKNKINKKAKSIFSLPMYPYLSEEKQLKTISELKKII